MKKFYILSALLSMVSFAFAQNSLSVESPAEVPQGGTGYIEVKYQFAQENYFANYSFDLYLPEGITLNQSKIVKGDCHSENHPAKYTVGQNTGDDGAYYSLAILSNPTTALTGTSDVLVRLAVDVASNLEIGAEHNAFIKKIRFASTGGNTIKFDDVSFTIKIVENRITLDENEGVTPETETPTGTQNVLVKRTIKADQWSTICLPFAMTAEQMKEAFGDGVQLANFTGITTTSDDDDNVTDIKVNFEAATEFEANHPYLIYVTSKIDEFKLDGVEVNPDEDGASVDCDKAGKGKNITYNSFIGTYTPNTVLGNEDDPWLFLSNNMFYYSKGTAKMKAFRGYFSFYEYLADVISDGSAKIGFSVDGDATSVDGLPAMQRVAEGVYDLQGRKMKIENGDISTLQKGVYIIDGKKVTIK